VTQLLGGAGRSAHQGPMALTWPETARARAGLKIAPSNGLSPWRSIDIVDIESAVLARGLLWSWPFSLWSLSCAGSLAKSSDFSHLRRLAGWGSVSRNKGMLDQRYREHSAGCRLRRARGIVSIRPIVG